MRLKTKLVVAISLMVVAIVVTLSTIYVAQLVHQVVNAGVNDGDLAVRQIIHLSRQALETDVSSTRIDPNNAQQVNEFIEESLQEDLGVNSVVESIIGYSPIISDAAVVGLDGRAILHSDPAMLGKPMPQRPDLHELAASRFWNQLRVVYGPIRTYAIKVPLDRDNRPFGSAQVGISSVFLKSISLFCDFDSGLAGAGCRAVELCAASARGDFPTLGSNDGRRNDCSLAARAEPFR
jgi:hypothetical protein